MKDSTEILFKLYQEEWIQCRHHQNLRSNMTNITMTITGALSAVIAFDEELNNHDLPLSILLIILGILAFTFSLKQHERFAFHLFRAREYRDRIEEEIGDLQLRKLRNKAKSESEKIYPRLHHLKLRHFWAIINLVATVIGVIIAALIFIK